AADAPAAATGKDSPGLAPLVMLAAIAAAAVLARRRPGQR
ncbi:MAG: hypothetical protein QOJ26_1764, partial [Thermoplasmata archaeon]|nr:hypothetical protein [Thermoplasmata archaeon]